MGNTNMNKKDKNLYGCCLGTNMASLPNLPLHNDKIVKERPLSIEEYIINQEKLTGDSCFWKHNWSVWKTLKSVEITDGAEYYVFNQLRHCKNCGEIENRIV